MRKSKMLFLTMGTAWGYSLEPRAEVAGVGGGGAVGEAEDQAVRCVVANCHRAPGRWFDKVLAPPSAVVTELTTAIESVRAVNPGLQVVLTVSPVRHTRDGMVENSRSKAVLLVAAGELVEALGDYVTYFPSYELMVDELRGERETPCTMHRATRMTRARTLAPSRTRTRTQPEPIRTLDFLLRTIAGSTKNKIKL